MWPYKKISHSQVLITFLSISPIKLKLGLQIIVQRLLIATHLEQSNYLPNQKQRQFNIYNWYETDSSRRSESCAFFRLIGFWLFYLIQDFQCRATNIELQWRCSLKLKSLCHNFLTMNQLCVNSRKYLDNSPKTEGDFALKVFKNPEFITKSKNHPTLFWIQCKGPLLYFVVLIKASMVIKWANFRGLYHYRENHIVLWCHYTSSFVITFLWNIPYSLDCNQMLTRIFKSWANKTN
jgi:hypothetical protein